MSFVHHSPSQFKRRCQVGAQLALMAVFSTFLVCLLGVCIYSGMQAYLEGDLQRVAMGSALAGASQYFKTTSSNQPPEANPAQAKSVATTMFSDLTKNSSLAGFQPKTQSVTSKDNMVTIQAQAVIPTAFLSLVGINQIQVNATASAKAVQYQLDGFSLLPNYPDINTYSKKLDLNYPLSDQPGVDIYIKQDEGDQQGYAVEACNQSDCYDITKAAQPSDTGKLQSPDGQPLMYGSAVIDLAKAGISKATSIRITHSNNFKFGYLSHGNHMDYKANESKPLVIDQITLYGYAITCSDPNACGAIPPNLVAGN